MQSLAKWRENPAEALSVLTGNPGRSRLFYQQRDVEPEGVLFRGTVNLAAVRPGRHHAGSVLFVSKLPQQNHAGHSAVVELPQSACRGRGAAEAMAGGPADGAQHPGPTGKA